jgi:hypothetical protein
MRPKEKITKAEWLRISKSVVRAEIRLQIGDRRHRIKISKDCGPDDDELSPSLKAEMILVAHSWGRTSKKEKTRIPERTWVEELTKLNPGLQSSASQKRLRKIVSLGACLDTNFSLRKISEAIDADDHETLSAIAELVRKRSKPETNIPDALKTVMFKFWMKRPNAGIPPLCQLTRNGLYEFCKMALRSPYLTFDTVLNTRKRLGLISATRERFNFLPAKGGGSKYSLSVCHACPAANNASPKAIRNSDASKLAKGLKIPFHLPDKNNRR